MGRLDIYSSAFWLVFSIYIAFESYCLDLGNWHIPGPGYFSFGAALLLGVMSLSVLVKTLLKPSKEKPSPLLRNSCAGRISSLSLSVCFSMFFFLIGLALLYVLFYF